MQIAHVREVFDPIIEKTFFLFCNYWIAASSFPLKLKQGAKVLSIFTESYVSACWNVKKKHPELQQVDKILCPEYIYGWQNCFSSSLLAKVNLQLQKELKKTQVHILPSENGATISFWYSCQTKNSLVCEPPSNNDLLTERTLLSPFQFRGWIYQNVKALVSVYCRCSDDFEGAVAHDTDTQGLLQALVSVKFDSSTRVFYR